MSEIKVLIYNHSNVLSGGSLPRHPNSFLDSDSIPIGEIVRVHSTPEIAAGGE